MTPPGRCAGPLPGGSTLAVNRTISPPHPGLLTVSAPSCASDGAAASSRRLTIRMGAPDNADLGVSHRLEFGIAGRRSRARTDQCRRHPHQEQSAGQRYGNGHTHRSAEKQHPPRTMLAEHALVERAGCVLDFPFVEKLAEFWIIGWFHVLLLWFPATALTCGADFLARDADEISRRRARRSSRVRFLP